VADLGTVLSEEEPPPIARLTSYRIKKKLRNDEKSEIGSTFGLGKRLAGAGLV